MQFRTFLACTALAAALAIGAASPARAMDDTSNDTGMSHETMAKDHMSKDKMGMKDDHMSKDDKGMSHDKGMAHDDMAKDKMEK